MKTLDVVAKGTSRLQLASKLGKLGFKNEVSGSGSKRYKTNHFIKNIGNNKLEENSTVAIRVSIHNNSTWGDKWTVDKIELLTARLNSDFLPILGSITLTANVRKKLLFIFNALEDLDG